MVFGEQLTVKLDFEAIGELGNVYGFRRLGEAGEGESERDRWREAKIAEHEG